MKNGSVVPLREFGYNEKTGQQNPDPNSKRNLKTGELAGGEKGGPKGGKKGKESAPTATIIDAMPPQSPYKLFFTRRGESSPPKGRHGDMSTRDPITAIYGI